MICVTRAPRSGKQHCPLAHHKLERSFFPLNPYHISSEFQLFPLADSSHDLARLFCVRARF